ncbi:MULTISPECIES: hypothetical protein [unclassified Rhizobium]|uniref:hypothetical protein n=1 Tax=unclassified Rhizobium TaxID=2613769 RepID=UPI001FDA0259|nr:MULTISPECIES: hypothetical protein [unclassified Rhizobium]
MAASRITFPSHRYGRRRSSHVSLYCVGKSARIPDAMIAAARRAGTAIEACQFELAFDHVITFLQPQNNAIGLAGNGGRELLRQLHVQIAIEMQRLGADANLNPNFNLMPPCSTTRTWCRG